MQTEITRLDPSATSAIAKREVTICECFARDGLQHEEAFIPTDVKVELIDRFTRIGFPRIEATSFSHPKHVPQFADAESLLQAMPRRRGTRYKATCANLQAVKRALVAKSKDHGPEEISFLISATQSHTQRNLKRSREEQWEVIEEMARVSVGEFVLVGAISMALGCIFEGEVDPAVVVEDAKRFQSLGVNLITVGDTAGMGTPATVSRLVGQLRAALPDASLAAHFHNTRGTAIANCVAAWQAGLTHFDSSFGGIGGHPAQIQYGEGNTGNVPTEDLVVMFESMGVNTGLNLELLMDTARFCERTLGRELLGMVTRTAYAGKSHATAGQDKYH